MSKPNTDWMVSSETASAGGAGVFVDEAVRWAVLWNWGVRHPERCVGMMRMMQLWHSSVFQTGLGGWYPNHKN